VLLTPGTRLGPYTIELLIGSGGMGEVYKAHDERLNRTVAIKRLIADDVSRFQSEARAIAAINHPHICQIYDVGPDYLVLEYLQGEPLGGPVTRDEAVRLASQIADALHAAHERGILHRDLKPGNVMVVRQGGTPHAKLLDFGVAQLASPDPGVTRTVAGEVMGTPAYMSPEQASAKPLDARSDVFSVGAVLYELLAGTRAFSGDSTAQILSAVLRDDPGPLDAPPALQQIVHRCLAKDPDRRFQTMADVSRALEKLAGSVDRTASIAVLPFANLSRDADDEYFSDGLTEEIISALTRVPGLKVIARTSAFAFKGKNEDIRRIANTLGVTHVLEGSVRRAGGRVRVMVQLIHAADGEPLSPHLRQWYGTFFLYATGRADEARLHLSRVIEEDPLCQMWRLMRANLLSSVGLEHEALEDASKAVELDPGFWLGWADLGLLHARRHQHAEAMQCAQRAMAGAPWCPYSIGVMAAALANQGQVNDAQPLLDGLRGDTYGGPVGLAVYFLARGEIEQAVEWSAKAVEQRFPALIPRLIRAFEPSLRRSAAWPSVLKKMNLA
jgi:TolB-like protein/predicted Ser/Thr protein kinase